MKAEKKKPIVIKIECSLSCWETFWNQNPMSNMPGMSTGPVKPDFVKQNQCKAHGLMTFLWNNICIRILFLTQPTAYSRCTVRRELLTILFFFETAPGLQSYYVKILKHYLTLCEMKIGFQYPVGKHVVYIFNLKYIKHKPVK